VTLLAAPPGTGPGASSARTRRWCSQANRNGADPPAAGHILHTAATRP